ncbi:hypothetical protein NUU61_007254 [Penicillium alfredii]|uniref:Protein kinase domain-containing protein n=1 Tax=Penicillium alfredii TaxID=1506179 RepID=A0A9W9K449_9EURO|nr:uncharacterized protein NUU61_007254 [Penicillium alfredii]KAJ5092384.1 hypothetical protein NUU61_007254 [Penicillium alfredii]
MEVIECLGDFGGPNDPVAFRFSRIIYRENGQAYQGLSNVHYPSKEEVKVEDLYNIALIPTENLHPNFDNSFTNVQVISPLWYIKRSRLSNYDPNNPNQFKAQVLKEAQICEQLRKAPHPNIAVYHGCEVKGGRITGLYFTKYNETLMERINPKKLNKRECASHRSGRPSTETTSWLEGIKSGLEHLHSLGIVHNDINPGNIMFDGATPVIIDFGSCSREGDDLSMIGQTFEWHDESIRQAKPQNDLNALQEVRFWLDGKVDAFQFSLSLASSK